MWVLVCSLALGQDGEGQYTPGFQQETLFGNAPSARHEAMARAGATLSAGTAGAFYNPATVGLVDDGHVVLSTSAPFYVLRASDYYVVGAAVRILGKWVVGLGLDRFAMGPSSFDVSINFVDYPVDRPTVDDLTLTNVVEIVDGLHVGVNVSAFRWKYIDEVPAAMAVLTDAGALFEAPLPVVGGVSHSARVGVAVSNVTAGRLTFASPAGDEATAAFPIVLRAGAAYTATTDIAVPGAGEGPLSVTALLELQEVLNSDVRTQVSGAAEAVLYDLLALRLGGYTVSEDDADFENNRSRVTDLTYGFGVRIPLDTMTNGRAPLTIDLDFAALEPASVVFSGPRLSNRRTFTASVSWRRPPPAPVELEGS